MDVTLNDRVRNEEIRQRCNIQDVVRWVRRRKREWNADVDRMSDERLPKIAKNKKSQNRRSPGRPPKRWMNSRTSTSQEQEQKRHGSGETTKDTLN